MYLLPRGGPGVAIPTTPREVYDVTGAGDMVLSVLALALAAGATPEEAARLANVAAGIEVERVGVVPVRKDEIAARLAVGVEAASLKVLDRREAPGIVERHRARRRRVVFTNGCFDVLHAGHVRFLQAAREEGDVLVVGLNADESVRRLKGDDRPVNGVADRLEVLAALAAVDHVVVFEEDDPLLLIGELLPDVLVKGEDWREKGVVGRELVEARGGRVVLLPLLARRSTTGLIDRIRRGG
jgi:D-beta-D-heptose 7-phosphate kinase/D-beta-D-heptose 1-phosphate adenosyltransferase